MLLVARICARFVPVWAGKWKVLDWINGVSLPDGPYDLVIVEDIGLLPAAFRAAAGSPVLFDAREYYPRQDDTNLWFKFLDRSHRVLLCRSYMTQCAAVVTVSPGIAAEYKREFGVDAQLVRSVPAYVEAQLTPANPHSIRMVHHGVANDNRKLEQMIEVMSLLDKRFSLDFYLTGNPEYISALQLAAEGDVRIRFRDAIPFEQIVSTLNGYDIGIFFVPPTTFNLKYCLPNKLFEFIQARLAVAISPTPDMADLVREYGCGLVAADFEPASMATALNALTPEAVTAYKRASDKAARELCFEVEGRKLAVLIERLAG